MEKFDYWNNVKMPIELVGYPNVFNPMAQFVSSSRVDMFAGHLMQAMVLNKSEPNKLFTGKEADLINYNFDKSKRKHSFEVLNIIPKYIDPMGNIPTTVCPLFYVIGLSDSPDGKRHLDVIEVEKYFMGQNGFGFIPSVSPLSIGDTIEPDELLVKSPRIQDGAYAPGINVNTIYASFPEPIEDAFIISESMYERLRTTAVKKKSISIRADWRPLNIYGDGNTDKFLPDLGQNVRDDGILCAFRPTSLTTAPADSDPRSLREILPFQDIIFQIPEPNAKIVDVTYYIGSKKPNSLYPQAEFYNRAHTKCWENVWNAYFSHKNKYPLSDAMWELVRRAIYHLLIDRETKVKPLDIDIGKFDVEGLSRQIVDFIQVEVTYTAERLERHGIKLTGIDGSKGVVGHIYPDEAMPIDEYGVRADLWIDVSSPVARNNPSQFYECGINRISLFVVQKMTEVQNSQGSDAAFEVAMEWCRDVNPNYEKLIREGCLDSVAKKIFVNDTIAKGFHLWIPPYLDTLMSAEGNKWHQLENIKKWQIKWGAWSTPVTFGTRQADGSFNYVTTEESFSIGSKYILLLNKLPEQYAPGIAHVNNFGIPVKSKYDSKNFPVGQNPYKLGEDEFRIIGLDVDSRWLTRVQGLLSTSPEATRAMIHAKFTAANPSQIDSIDISNGEIYRSSGILKVFHNTSAVLGFDTKNTLISREDIPDDIYSQVWVNDLTDDSDENPDPREQEEEVRARHARKTEIKRERNRRFVLGDEDDGDPAFSPEAEDDDESDGVLESDD